jgi:hypothetical protein
VCFQIQPLTLQPGRPKGSKNKVASAAKLTPKRRTSAGTTPRATPTGKRVKMEQGGDTGGDTGDDTGGDTGGDIASQLRLAKVGGV